MKDWKFISIRMSIVVSVRLGTSLMTKSVSCCLTHVTLSTAQGRKRLLQRDSGYWFLTYQCLKVRIISVLIHCRQNLSQTSGLCEISVAIFEISYTRRSTSWRTKLSDNVGFYRRDRASLNYSISILLVWRKMFKDERCAREKRVRNCFKYWSWIEQRWKESEVIRK